MENYFWIILFNNKKDSINLRLILKVCNLQICVLLSILVHVHDVHYIKIRNLVD